MRGGVGGEAVYTAILCTVGYPKMGNFVSTSKSFVLALKTQYKKPMGCLETGVLAFRGSTKHSQFPRDLSDDFSLPQLGHDPFTPNVVDLYTSARVAYDQPNGSTHEL
jgi:hypothetical protein